MCRELLDRTCQTAWRQRSHALTQSREVWLLSWPIYNVHPELWLITNYIYSARKLWYWNLLFLLWNILVIISGCDLGNLYRSRVDIHQAIRLLKRALPNAKFSFGNWLEPLCQAGNAMTSPHSARQVGARRGRAQTQGHQRSHFLLFVAIYFFISYCVSFI